MVILGRGALARPDGAAVLAAAWQVAAQRRCAAAGLARLQPAAPVRRPGRRAGPRLRARAGRQDARRDAGRRGRRAVAARRRRVRPGARSRPSTFVIYQGHHGDARRGAGRRDPAGRRLHREGRDLRQHRGPRAARPAWRCIRRARRGRTGGSSARVQRGARPARCPTTPRRSCARGWRQANPVFGRRRLRRAAAAPTRPARPAIRRAMSDAPFVPAIAELLPGRRRSPRASDAMAECARDLWRPPALGAAAE